MSSLSIGIVGLPNVGKSTLFKLLTRQEVVIANYPFATIDPNVGVVPVPDERVDTLAALSKSAKVVPAIVEFFDIAGLVRGANRGEGLGNQFLSHIREVSVIVHVVRCFGGEEIVHIEGGVDPVRDLETIETELAFKDLEAVERRLHKAEGEARAGAREAVQLRDALASIRTVLGQGKLLAADPIGRRPGVHAGIIRELNLLTAKPQLFLLNGNQADVPEALLERIAALHAEYLVADLRTATAIPELIRRAYRTLNLISFFTTGEDETRAWTIERGTKAPQAAGVIHSDFEAKFIRAEAINWEQLLKVGSPSTGSGANAWNQAKQKGMLRLEGKDYVVQDGDVVVIRHG